MGNETRVGRARNNSFHRTACQTLQRKLVQTRGMLLRPICDFQLRVPRRRVKQTVASVRQVGNAFRPPRARKRFTVLYKDTPITYVQNCRRRIASCDENHKGLFYALRNCTTYRGTRRIVTTTNCSPRTSLRGPPSSIFYTRKTKFIMS